MALVSPPCSVPGLGSKVSSWLGPPAIQSRMHAICRLRRSAAWSTIRSVKLTGIAAEAGQSGRPQARSSGGNAGGGSRRRRSSPPAPFLFRVP